MDKEEVFGLDDIDISSDTFEEDEERAFKTLSLDRTGMKELLMYLQCYDSRQGWLFLFEHYTSFMTAEEYTQYRKLAIQVSRDLEYFIDEEM